MEKTDLRFKAGPVMGKSQDKEDVDIHAYIYVPTQLHICMHAYIHMYAYMHICNVCRYIHYACMSTYLHKLYAYMHIHTDSCMSAYIHTLMYTFI